MITTVVSAPVNEPVTLLEAKEQLRIEQSFTLDDTFISALIIAARERCEHYCNSFFTVQTIKISIERAGTVSRGLTITGCTIDGVAASYEYNDLTGAISFYGLTGDIVLTATTSAPASIQSVKQAIKIIVTDLYQNREETIVGASVAENPAVKALLYPYRQGLRIWGRLLII